LEVNLKSKTKISGMVKVFVIGRDGHIKTYPRSFWRKLLGLPAKRMIIVHHNTITSAGEELIADWMLATPTKTKITSVNGYLQLGTGWTGNSTKLNSRCNTPVGSMQQIDSGFPHISDDSGNIIVYQATFSPGTIEATDINEAALLNGNGTTAECLAYAQLSPQVTMTLLDSIAVEWSITIDGS
jgi:hypothetical protein